MAALTLMGGMAVDAATKPTAKQLTFFEKRIRPLLVAKCYECHSTKSKKVKGGLLLDSAEGWRAGGDSGEAIVPGKPEESLVIEAVRYKNRDMEMPPKGKLKDHEIVALEAWVKMGAPDPRMGSAKGIKKQKIDIEEGRKFWSFVKPVKGTPPVVENDDWAKDGISRFILASLEEKGLNPVGETDRVTLIRRVSFDLIGLPPTPAEVDAFVHDKSPNAYEKLVDRLLASKHFGERWGRHWLDVARYAESTGKTRNYPYPHAWKYRDWVIEAINKDKPYDRFVMEQVAGDLLAGRTADQRNSQKIATGMFAMGSYDLNERNTRQFKMDVVDEQIDTMGRAFLGLTLGCARCHNHKFDPVPTTNYYALAGIFVSSEAKFGYGSRQGGGNRMSNALLVSLEKAGEDNNGATTAKNVPVQQSLSKKEYDRRMTMLNAQLKQAQRRLKRLSNSAAKRSKNKRRNKNATNGQTEQLKKTIAGLQRQVRSLRKQSPQGGTRGSGNVAMGLAEGNRVADVKVHIRGEISNLGRLVKRGFVEVITDRNKSTHATGKGSGRLDLARWLVDEGNPLTARVAVNRVWHHLFGRGLVSTVDNFGATGSRPTHPELLDYLAVEFMEDGWSMKGLIKRITMSKAYRMSSAHNTKSYEVDPDNLLLWRMNRKRLEVEAIRDAMMFVAGSLNMKPAVASPVARYGNGEIRRNAQIDSVTTGSSHRSVYVPILRGYEPEMFSIFDFAEPSEVKGRRDITTVAPQALFMMNSEFAMTQAKRAAEDMLTRSELKNLTRVKHAYRNALGREPSKAELDRAVRYVFNYIQSKGESKAAVTEAWASLYHALFASAEFRYVY